MGKDLTHQQFGRWVVVGRAESKNGQHTFWKCICECGTRRIVRGSYLLTGRSVSCGCYFKMRAEISNANRFKSLEGKKFGRLQVGEMWRKIGNVFYWETKCDCGNFFIANGSNLKNGVARSCGCLKSEKLSIANQRRMKTQKRQRNGQFAPSV